MKHISTLALVLLSINIAHAQPADTASNIELQDEIGEVTVAGRQKGDHVSKLNTLTTNVITQAGLTKLACCNLAESFENTAAVTVGFSDAVTGARQIRMLGLSGAYTQMLDESRPAMRGLSSAFGLGYTPGAWLESIQISKGIASVAYGYESITGQINSEYRKPTDEDRLFVNAYLNSELRSEINIVGTIPASDKLSGNILAHASFDGMMLDLNGDGFADLPQTLQVNGASRWLYKPNDEVQLRTGVNFVYENRLSGQTDYHAQGNPIAVHTQARPYGSDTTKYGSVAANRHFNAYAKFGTHFGEHPENSVAVIADYTLQQQDSYFGQKRYNGDEHSVYVNGLLQLGFGAPDDHTHLLMMGVNTRGDRYNEEYRFTAAAANYSDLLNQNEYVAGAFGEYTYHVENKLSAIVGFRTDYNNLYGVLLTPRGHIRWNAMPDLTVRASAGRGFRSANILIDNLWTLATRRDIVVLEKPKIEDAWTYGVNVTKYFNDADGFETASVSADVFRTQFNNQVIVDQEVMNGSGTPIIAVYNLNGRSYANNYQVDFSVEPLLRFFVKTSFRYSDTKVELREMGFVDKPLIDKFKGLLDLEYATKFNIWRFNLTAQINGQSRLPSAQYLSYGVDEHSPRYRKYSPVYPMFFGQITRRYRAWDFYLGVENIFNYMQEQAIISAGDPLDDRFNASVIWGPLMGRKVYAGVRWTLGK